MGSKTISMFRYDDLEILDSMEERMTLISLSSRWGSISREIYIGKLLSLLAIEMGQWLYMLCVNGGVMEYQTVGNNIQNIPKYLTHKIKLTNTHFISKKL